MTRMAMVEASAPRQSLLHCAASCIHGRRARASYLRLLGDEDSAGEPQAGALGNISSLLL
jgi:hypothetical protein